MKSSSHVRNDWRNDFFHDHRVENRKCLRAQAHRHTHCAMNGAHCMFCFLPWLHCLASYKHTQRHTQTHKHRQHTHIYWLYTELCRCPCERVAEYPNARKTHRRSRSLSIDLVVLNKNIPRRTANSNGEKLEESHRVKAHIEKDLGVFYPLFYPRPIAGAWR